MKTPPSPWAWSIILLLLVCLPRLSIDMYLPSLPAMADALHASDGQLQLTLSVFMAGSAASMLLCGPLADRCGRRPVLLAGSVVDAAFGWRAVFGVLCALGLLSLCLSLLYVPETRPARVAPQQNVLALYRRLLGEAYFLRYALAIGWWPAAWRRSTWRHWWRRCCWQWCRSAWRFPPASWRCCSRMARRRAAPQACSFSCRY